MIDTNRITTSKDREGVQYTCASIEGCGWWGYLIPIGFDGRECAWVECPECGLSGNVNPLDE